MHICTSSKEYIAVEPLLYRVIMMIEGHSCSALNEIKMVEEKHSYSALNEVE